MSVVRLFAQSISQLENHTEQIELLATLIHKTKRNVLVCGIGKTGYIAQLFSAGLKSIGISCFYIHLTEAAHGDLGTLSPNDLVIILSKSGNSFEATQLIRYCQNNKIPLFAITMGGNSPLAKSANYVFVLPSVKESSPVEIVPTTSNVVFVAAIELCKIALMNQRGFTASAFLETHPGGNIGNNGNKPVELFLQAANKNLLCDIQTNIFTAVAQMTSNLTGCLLITHNSQLQGILTDGDVRRAVQKKLSFAETTLQAIMNSSPTTIQNTTTVTEAIYIMISKGISQLPVLNSKDILGVVLLSNLTLAMLPTSDITTYPKSLL